jgi:two-component sensor histidine kinase
MIYLAANENLPKAVKPILEELDSRVRSVAELYSLLYSSGSVSEVPLDIYFSRIAASLIGLAPNVKLVTNFEKIVTQAREAAPLGLILTELITNAYKYAFPSSGEGEISVALFRKGSLYVLEVSDDGVGLPQGFDAAKNPGMGIKLVAGLAEQFGGEFVIMGVKVGTHASISWNAG